MFTQIFIFLNYRTVYNKYFLNNPSNLAPNIEKALKPEKEWKIKSNNTPTTGHNNIQVMANFAGSR